MGFGLAKTNEFYAEDSCGLTENLEVPEQEAVRIAVIRMKNFLKLC